MKALEAAETSSSLMDNSSSSSPAPRHPGPSAPLAETKSAPFVASLGLSSSSVTPNLHSVSCLQLPLPLLDVRDDSKKYQTANSLMGPITVAGKFPAGIADNCFNYKIFAEPVLISESGETYEKEVILQWLEEHDSDPIQIHTKIAKNPNLVIIQNTKRAVDEFLQAHDALRDSTHIYLPQSWVKELELACAQGNANQVRFLCGRDRRLVSWKIDDFDIKNSQWRGKRALHLACAQGTLDVVEELVRLAEARAEGLALLLLLQQDDQGRLPVHYAVLNNTSPQLALHLVARMGMALVGIKPLAVNPAVKNVPEDDAPREITALHLAAIHSDPKLLSALLESHALNLDSRDHLGNTALHIAIERGAEAAMELLLRAGAAFDIENDQGQTAQMLAAVSKSDIAARFRALITELEQDLSRQGPLGLRLLQQQRTNAQLQAKAAKQQQQNNAFRELIQAQADELATLKQSSNLNLARLTAQSSKLEQKENYVRQHHAELTVSAHAKPITSAGELRQLTIEAIAKNPLIATARFLYWQPSDSKNKFSLKRSLGDAKEIGAAALLPDGSVVTADAVNGQHWVWNVAEGTRVKKHAPASNTPISVLAIEPNNHYVVSARLPLEPGDKKAWFCACKACSEGNEHGLAADHVHNVASIDTQKLTDGEKARYRPHSYENFISSVSNTAKSRIEVWDIKESKRIAKYTLNHKRTAALVALPGGGIVASTEAYGQLTAYGSISWVARYNKAIRALAWLSEGRIIAGADDCTLQVWDTSNGKRISTFLGHRHPVTALAVLDGGAKVISGDSDGELRLWDIAKGSCGAVCSGHSSWLTNAAVTSVALLDNGLVASASKDKTVKIWQIGKDNWDCIATLQHKGAVQKVMASKDDGLISHTEDGNLHVWQGGLPLDLDLQFCSGLVGASVEQADFQIIVNTAQPSKPALEGCARALRVLYPDQPLSITIPSAQKLVIDGLKDARSCRELIELIHAFGVQKPQQQHPVSFSGAYSHGVLPPPPSHTSPDNPRNSPEASDEALPVARLVTPQQPGKDNSAAFKTAYF